MMNDDICNQVRRVLEAAYTEKMQGEHLDPSVAAEMAISVLSMPQFRDLAKVQFAPYPLDSPLDSLGAMLAAIRIVTGESGLCVTSSTAEDLGDSIRVDITGHRTVTASEIVVVELSITTPTKES